MMTLKIWYHCDSFSIRPLDELIEGGRWLGLPPFSSWRSGWRFTVLARFFSESEVLNSDGECSATKKTHHLYLETRC
jgi:hypothetical protein